jgi:hypothetical protein
MVAHRLVECLSAANHGVKHAPRLIAMRGHNAELLNLLKLMHAENAQCVSAVATGLLAEASGDTCVPDGQLVCVHPLAAVQGGERLLRGGDQILIFTLTSDLVQLLVELLELGNLGHDALRHKEGCVHGLVVAVGEEGHGILLQGHLQQHTAAFEVESAVSGSCRSCVLTKQTTNRQQTTDNRQQTTDNRQQTTGNRQQATQSVSVSGIVQNQPTESNQPLVVSIMSRASMRSTWFLRPGSSLMVPHERTTSLLASSLDTTTSWCTTFPMRTSREVRSTSLAAAASLALAISSY